MKYLFSTLLLALFLMPVASRAQPVQNADARPLQIAERAVFAKLVCPGGKAPGQDNYQFQCPLLSGYPGDAGDPANGPFNILFSSIIYGHLTSASLTQAYVSYQGDFESGATNGGGGILFDQTKGGWRLAQWFPGGQLDDCVQLNSSGRAEMLCLTGYFGQGESDASVWLAIIQPDYDPNGKDTALKLAVLKAQDDRQTDTPNYNCGKLTNPGQSILLDIENLTRSNAPGSLAAAKISYVEPGAAARFCKANDFADAPVTEGTVQFTWDGSRVRMRPELSFAPVDY
jgi:hypothetical protein